jgi:SAM-dependent methyltransferase
MRKQAGRESMAHHHSENPGSRPHEESRSAAGRNDLSQAEAWSRAAADYESEFVDPYLPEVRNPLRDALAALADKGRTAADLGCGLGPLLPLLAERFQWVHAVDFAAGMLERARERCAGLQNIEFWQRRFTGLRELRGCIDVAVAVNSLILPDLNELERALRSVRRLLRPEGRLLGIVPALDGVHYFTMLLVDRARRAGMPIEKARQNAAHHAEHALYDFAFGEFRYQGLVQHFWQPFEVRYRLRRAGFGRVRLAKVHLSWQQFGCARDLGHLPPPWDWFFEAEPRSRPNA